MAYNTPETVADYLARFQMEITHRGKGTFTPDHVKYSLTIASGGKDFFTTFESNPHVHGEPTITQVFGALASDAMVVRDYGMDEFVDEFCDGMKPSAAIRAYNSCKETYDWMRDGLYLSNGDIASLSEVISENEEEIGALVEKAASERAARYAYDHPKLPKGFVTIEQLQGDLDLGDSRDEVEDFDFDGDLTVAFSETADYKVDSNYHALLTWLPDHTEWLEQAEFDGLLEGCKGDIYKMVQMAQYEYIKSDLYDHREDICRYGTLDQLRDMGVYAIRESLADEILNDLSYDEDYAPTDDAKDTVMGAVSAAFKERYGEDFAEVATDFGQDIDDIAGRANPYVLSVDTVRAVNEKGYDAVTRIICPSKGLPPWESTMSLAMRTSSSTTSITARNSAPPLVIWNSPSDALLRNTRKRKGRSLTTSPPANGACILSTPESVTVSMVA